MSNYLRQNARPEGQNVTSGVVSHRHLGARRMVSTATLTRAADFLAGTTQKTNTLSAKSDRGSPWSDSSRLGAIQFRHSLVDTDSNDSKAAADRTDSWQLELNCGDLDDDGG